jgi:hypothetical protein
MAFKLFAKSAPLSAWLFALCVNQLLGEFRAALPKK